MPASTGRQAEVAQLLSQAEDMEHRFKAWQEEPTSATQDVVTAAQREYNEWFAKAIRHLPAERQAEFRDLFEGGMFITRIRGFLADPLATNQLYDPAEPNPFVDKWQHPFATEFRDNIVQQRAILTEAVHAEVSVVAVLDELTEIFRRFPDYLAVLQAAHNELVPPPSIQTERELQVVVQAILRLLYGDVRPEDAVSQFAGGSSRVDFSLREARIIVETKMTRPTLSDKRVGEELLVDWARYARHPDCQGIFAFIYDPDRHITNAPGLEADLSRTTEEPVTRAVVVR